MQFFESIRAINDAELYKHSRKFPNFTLDTIDENFTLKDNEDKFNLYDQNINNIIIETSSHNIDYIRNLISFYKENINNFNQNVKRLIIVIFLNVNVELNYELDFTGNYDLLFHQDLFPSNPNQSDLFDFIRKMNHLLYNLFSNIKLNQQEELLNTIKSIWDQNDINWIYNLFPFICQIIKNHNEHVFTVFTNSNFFTDSFLAKSYKDPNLFQLVSKIFLINSKVHMNQKILDYLENTIEHKEYRKPLIEWITTGLKTFSQMKNIDKDIQSVINKLISLFLAITAKDDLKDDEKDYALDSIIEPLILLDTNVLLDLNSINQILNQLSAFSNISSDYYFKFLNFLSSLNDKFEVFDNSSFDSVFENMKKSKFQKADIEKLWEFTLKKDVKSEKNNDKILNWRGIELLLSYIEVDESNIAEKLQSLIIIQSNIYELHKANLTMFLIKRIYKTQNNRVIFHAYYFTLEMMISIILTVEEMFGLLDLIKLNDFKYPSEIIQAFDNIIHKPVEQFNPKSFIRFDRENQFLYGPSRKITDSHSICFSFKLTQKVDDSLNYEILSILHQEKKKFCSLFLNKKALNVEIPHKDSTAVFVVDDFQIQNEEWHFIEISINNKFSNLRLRTDEMEKYIEYKIMIRKNSITELFKKESSSRGYQIAIKSSVFDYSNIFVLQNPIESKRPSFYFLMNEYKMDFMKIQSILPNNLNYCLYPTFHEGRKSNSLKCIRNYNIDIINEIENNDVSFNGRTISNISNIFDIMESFDIRKFFLTLFNRINSTSVYNASQGQSYLSKLILFFGTLNFLKTKTVELFSIALNSVDPKFISFSEMNKLFDLWNLLKSKKIKREFLQSIFFNFSFISKLNEDIQIELFKKCSITNQLDVKSFESLLFNAINYYGKENNVSDYAWVLLSKIFNPNNNNDIESIITTVMKNISNYITIKCITILTDTITRIECNEASTTKKLFSLTVYLASLNDIEIQTLGIKLFCLVERYFNIAENATNIKQTPINSSKYVYQIILSSNVDHNTNQFDIMTQNIFNYFIPDTELQTKQDEQIKLQPRNSSTNEILESTNEIKISNVTIFPLIVYYSSFCSKEVKNKLIELFNSNTKTNYLSSILDLNLWYFWITNFLSQYSNNNNSDLSFFINPFIDFFFCDLSFQSSTKKITEFFLFLENYSAKLKFDYRQIQLLILIRLLTEFNNSNSEKEISLLYPIIYSCLQIEIKNDSFEIITNKEYNVEENKEEDEKLFKLFTNRYSDNFKFANESTNETDQNLRLLLIQSVLNLKENVLVNLNGCDKTDIYLLTSFILFDYVNENKSGDSDQLLTNYKNTISGLQTKYSKKYKKCLEILSNITNKELIKDLEKKVLTKYFQESKTNHKNKLHEINDHILNDLKESEITQIKIEGKNNQEICQLLIRNDKEINQFLKEKFDCYDLTRDEKMGREKLRIQRIQSSYQNDMSKNTIDKKYKILNQISIGGTRILMSINNTFTNHIDNKIKWLGKIEIKNSYKYQLSPYSKELIKVSLNAKLLTITEVIDGILFIIENRIVFYSSLKAIEIQFHSISFIFNRVFSDLENEYQGCEIFTNENRSFYFVFGGKRETFYNYLPDYNQYIALVAAKYQMEQKKSIDLNFDETLKFDFLGNCRKICQSIYQNQSSTNLLLQLNLISKWQNYTISNFEYIYYLNMLSNRSYHIGSRYPYYPSLLRQFDSDKINLNDNSNYRDLCVPTITHFKEQFCALPLSSFPISDHSISYLMVRVEPFTTLMFCINDQKFDTRIFSTAKSMWEKEPILSSPELIPEVFGLPFYLVNENKFDFGKKVDGETINDVTLPVWSKNHFVFTAVQRLMLENDCSSKNMAKWIDMTFGITQNTYDGQTLFLESKACLVGCLPDQIIKGRNHPDRFSKTVDDSNSTNNSSTNNNNNNGSGLSALNEVVRSPLLNLTKEKGGFNFTNENKKSNILGIEKEFVYFRTGNSNFIVDINQSPFVTMQVPNESGELLCVSRPLKLAVFGVKSEDHLTVLNLQKKTISIQCKTIAKILCAQSIGGRFILTGGSDCVVRVWDMEHNFCQVSSSCFHNDEVIAVAGCRNTGIIASIDRSMNLVVETLYKRKLIAFVPIEESPEKPLIQITKSGLIILANKGKINCLDSRGREIHKFDFCKENIGLAVSLNLYYDIDSREIVAVALMNGEIVLIDLTNFEIIGRNVINDFSGKFLVMCTMKKSRAILFSDGEKTKSLLFGKLIQSEISNDKNSDDKQNVSEMESFCFN